MIVAIPSNSDAGLDAPISQHFGHCPAFTLVNVDQGQVGEIKILPNTGHTQGGCMQVVNFLKDAGAEAIISGGMGMRPLRGFRQVGIQVFTNGGAATVGDAVALLVAEQVSAFDDSNTCGGGGGGCNS